MHSYDFQGFATLSFEELLTLFRSEDMTHVLRSIGEPILRSKTQRMDFLLELANVLIPEVHMSVLDILRQFRKEDLARVCEGLDIPIGNAEEMAVLLAMKVDRIETDDDEEPDESVLEELGRQLADFMPRGWETANAPSIPKVEPIQQAQPVPAFYVEESLAHSLVEHVSAVNPKRAYGILAGEHGVASHSYQIANADAEQDSWATDLQDQIQAIENLNLGILGFYSSVSEPPAYPSSDDVRIAVESDWVEHGLSWLYVYLDDDNLKEEIRAFKVTNTGDLLEQQIAVSSASSVEFPAIDPPDLGTREAEQDIATVISNGESSADQASDSFGIPVRTVPVFGLFGLLLGAILLLIVGLIVWLISALV